MQMVVLAVGEHPVAQPAAVQHGKVVGRRAHTVPKNQWRGAVQTQRLIGKRASGVGRLTQDGMRRQGTVCRTDREAVSGARGAAMGTDGYIVSGLARGCPRKVQDPGGAARVGGLLVVV